MAVSAHDFERSLPKALHDKRVILLHGDNIQIKADLFRLIRKSLSIEIDDPFRLAQLDSDSLESDVGRLADELGAISMLGGSRLVRVTASTRQVEAVVDCAASAPAGDWLLLVDADELDANRLSALRGVPGILIVDCTSAPAGDFHSFVRSQFDRAGASIDDGVLEILIPLLGEDRAAARGEVEKLALLGDRSKSVTIDDVRDIVADSSSVIADEVGVSVMSGSLPALSVALNRLQTTGSDATGALGAALRLALNLYRARANQWRTKPDMVQNLSLADLRAVVLALQSAVLQTRSDGPNASLLAERALISLGNSLRARRRSGR